MILDRLRPTEEPFYIELVDINGTLLRNVPFRMYAVQCDNRRFVTSGVADADGRVTGLLLRELGLDSTALVEFEVVVKVETTDKIERPTGFDTLYVQTIRSRRLLPNGDFAFDEIRNLQNQRARLTHSMKGFRFVVCIEWDATREYVDTVMSWLRQSNSLLLDITDGQAFIESVIILDSKDRWGARDIAFEASNTVWPHVTQLGGFYYGWATQWLGHAAYMPRAHYGMPLWNRNISSQTDWLARVGMNVVPVLVHELGHLVFGWVDEYSSWMIWHNGEGGTLARASTAGRVFGIMHYNYLDNNIPGRSRMTTELSSDNTVWTTTGDDLYSATFQFTTHRRPCWEHYRDSYTRTETIGTTRVESRILRPVDRTRSPGDSIIVGPRDYWTNFRSCIYQPEIQIIDATRNTTAREGSLRVHNGGVPFREIDIDLLRSATNREKLSYQGKTADDGMFRVLGMLPGNIIKVHGRSGFDAVTSSIARAVNGELIVPSFGTEKWAEHSQQDIALDLEASIVSLTSRYLFFVANASGSSTTLRYQRHGHDANVTTVKHESGTAEVSVPVLTTDSTAYLSIRIAMYESGNAVNIYSNNGGVQILRGPDVKLGGTRFSVASGFVPPPFDGIGEGEELLSDLFSIGGDGPLDGLKSATVQIWKLPAKGRYARLHKWNETSVKWEPLTTFAGDSSLTVAGEINGAGTYAVFSTPEGLSSVDDANMKSIRVFPNPSTSRITVLTTDLSTSVEVFDLAGSRLMAAVKISDGRWEADLSGLVNGLYFVRVTSGADVTLKAVVLKR